MKRAAITTLLAVLIALCGTGCLSINADELYSLPEVSEEYLRLQAHINNLLSRGWVYAAPARGPNRQAVQLKDLNSNGTNEVIAFFTGPDDSKLMIYIFTMVGDDYVNADVIESAGTEIDSVRYIDMDGDGIQEIVIGWQAGSTQKYMSVYSIVDFHNKLIISGEEYNEITSFNAAGSVGEDIVIFKLPAQETGSAVAVLYSLMQDGEIVSEEARLSAGIDSINRILTGTLTDNTPALFIDSEGRLENGSLVTDILSVRSGSFENISLNPTAGISVETVRHRMNSSDITGDGVVKVPALRRLIAQSETEYYAIDWYAYSRSGNRILALTTYHNTFDEWYLILPGDWRGKVSVRREDSVPGERTIIFSYFDNPDVETYDDFLKIYRLSGETAQERATAAGRVHLRTEGPVAYAFELLVPANSFGLTFDEAMVQENFNLIYTQWQPR